VASEARMNQKTAHDNMELALNQLQERFKAEQRVVRDLQATIDSLTARTEGDKQGRRQEKSALEKRNNQLQSRIQELEFECHQLKAAPRSKFTNGRTSTSTVTTDPQFIWLQQENERLRDLLRNTSQIPRPSRSGSVNSRLK
jgi:predicted RNase H-like nuclease (RuvC/YqgF family)